MTARTGAVLLAMLAALLHFVVARPLQERAEASAERYQSMRVARQAERTRAAHSDQRSRQARAAALLGSRTRSEGEDAARTVRRSVVATLDRSHVRGVRLAVTPARGKPTAVRLSAEGSFAEVTRLSGDLVAPLAGLVLDSVRLSPRGRTIALDVQAHTLELSP